MRTTLKLKKPITDFEIDIDENSFEGFDLIKWIPCENGKNLPDAEEVVLLSCHDDFGDTSFDFVCSGWLTTEKEYWIVDNAINTCVVAWAPFPKPYKVRKKDE